MERKTEVQNEFKFNEEDPTEGSESLLLHTVLVSSSIKIIVYQYIANSFILIPYTPDRLQSYIRLEVYNFVCQRLARNKETRINHEICW